MTRLKRLFWPSNLPGQLMLLLVTALLLANLIAIAGIQRVGALLHPVARSLAVERLSVAWQAQAQLSAAESARLLASLPKKASRFWVDTQPEVLPFRMQREERKLARELREMLSLSPHTSVVMQLERADGGHARGAWFSGLDVSPLRLRTAVLLPDGRYLNGIQPMEQAREWSRLLAYCLMVATVPLALICFFVIVRVVRPVRLLARAADRFSRGESTAPLPLRGPEEARELTRAFNQMQVRLARHIESRTQMLAAMSHDLNTPLTGLRLQVELLPPGEDRDDMLESLNDLRAMVSETLNFIRGEASEEASQTVSLTALLEELVRRYQRPGKSVAWQGAETLMIDCRPVALRRALGNLIDNALAYGGDATLTLHGEKEAVRIEVMDNGPGIPDDKLAHVLEPFVRLQGARPDGVRESGGGLGLGLSIARACVHAHGGELTLTHRQPHGLCVTLNLPTAIRS